MASVFSNVVFFGGGWGWVNENFNKTSHLAKPILIPLGVRGVFKKHKCRNHLIQFKMIWLVSICHLIEIDFKNVI